MIESRRPAVGLAAVRTWWILRVFSRVFGHGDAVHGSEFPARRSRRSGPVAAQSLDAADPSPCMSICSFKVHTKHLLFCYLDKVRVLEQSTYGIDKTAGHVKDA